MNPRPASVPTDPASTLGHLQELQGKTRSDLHAVWFPLVLFGVLTLISVPVILIAGRGAGVAVYWAVAGPTGGLAIALYYHSRQQRLGVARPAAPYVATAMALLVGAFVLPALTSGRVQEVVSTFAVAGAYLLFAALDRSVAIGALGLVMVAVPIAALASAIDHPGPLVAGTTGTLILATGIAALSAERKE